MKNVNWKAAGVCLATSIFCSFSAYIAGHAICMHQHVEPKGQNAVMLDENGKLSYKKYVIEAFKDYKRVMDDPLGIEKVSLK